MPEIAAYANYSVLRIGEFKHREDDDGGESRKRQKQCSLPVCSGNTIHAAQRLDETSFPLLFISHCI